MTKDETLTFLRSLPPRTDQSTGAQLDRHGRIDGVGVSAWVLAEYAACREYPYLASCAKEINTKHALNLTPDQLRDLETLCYFASKKKHRDDDEAEGWEDCSDDWLSYRVGRKIEIRGESIFGYSVTVCKVIRDGGGTLRVMKPRARRYAVYHQGKKARDMGHGPARPMAGAVGVSMNGRKMETQPGTEAA